jgi:Tol biopolymer transport system component
MTPERWSRIREVFGAVLETPESERLRFLVSACGEDADLRAEVERLLAAHQEPTWASPTLTLFPLTTELAPGDAMAHFRIGSSLGEGGMGVVYRAYDTRLCRDVALKVLPTNMADSDRRGRFEREARAVAALSHPNIVAVHDVGREGELLYIAEELIEGESLRTRLRRGAVPLKELYRIAVQLADGVAAAHAARITHRDLKPENVMLTRDGRVKILDFGLARQAAMNATGDRASTAMEQLVTEPGTILGTVAYMSPEQVRGETADYRSDQFSLGVMFYEMAAGGRPFERETSVQTMSAILTEEPKPPDARIPAPLRWTIARCMEKDPAGRYESTRDLYQELRGQQEHFSDIVTSTEALPQASGRAEEPWRLWLTLASALVLTGIAAVALLGGAAFSGKPEDLAAYHFIALATEQGAKGTPAWSSDGRTVAYAATADGVPQIFARSLDQPVPAQITHTKIECWAPFWSPDNTRILFLSPGIAAPEGRTLWEIGAAGGVPEARLKGILAAHLSPDGRVLAFARRGANGLSVWVQPVEHSEPRQLSPQFSGKDAYLRFSPDGTSIGLWTAVGEGKLVFWRITYPSGKATAKFASVSNARGVEITTFTWFPDSRHVVFSGALSRPGTDHLLLADTKTGSIRPITADFANEADPSLSPDGKRLAFSSRIDDTDIVEVPLDGSHIRDILATSTNEHCATWSPKGDQFAYVKERNGRDEIWVHHIREGWERRLITPSDFRQGPTDRVTEPSYSPDGQRLAFTRVSEGRFSLWVTNAIGGPPVPLGVESALVPVWSPDGVWIAYTDISAPQAGLSKIAVGRASKPVMIIPPGEGAAPIVRSQWSPRGDWLTWKGPHGLEVVSPDGHRRKLLSEETGWQQVSGFSMDGTEVYAIRANPDHHLLVEAFEIATRRKRVISDLGAEASAHGFSLARDGKTFLTSLGRRRADIWLFDGFGVP